MTQSPTVKVSEGSFQGVGGLNIFTRTWRTEGDPRVDQAGVDARVRALLRQRRGGVPVRALEGVVGRRCDVDATDAGAGGRRQQRVVLAHRAPRAGHAELAVPLQLAREVQPQAELRARR